MTRTASKSREQVYKQLVMARGLVPRGHLLASRLLLSFYSIAMTRIAGKFHHNDKVLGQETRGSRLPRRVFYTSRNDKNRGASSIAMTRIAGKFHCNKKVCVRFLHRQKSPFPIKQIFMKRFPNNNIFKNLFSKKQGFYLGIPINIFR
jgi:hypothetical protein